MLIRLQLLEKLRRWRVLAQQKSPISHQLNAYTCTECGRCTSECPANQTAKTIAQENHDGYPRRLTEVGNNMDKTTVFDDGKKLLGDYITAEELWACTSCNACVQACPVDIDPLSIIMQMWHIW